MLGEITVNIIMDRLDANPVAWRRGTTTRSRGKVSEVGDGEQIVGIGAATNILLLSAMLGRGLRIDSRFVRVDHLVLYEIVARIEISIGLTAGLRH